MTTRVHVAISMQPEDQAKLNAMADKLGMRPSELVRELVEKLEADEVTQQIILNKFFNENKDKLGRERLLRIMSIRSSLKKDGANSNHDAAGSVSLSNQENNSAYNRVNQSSEFWEMSEEDLIRIAKAPWANGEDEKNA